MQLPRATRLVVRIAGKPPQWKKDTLQDYVLYAIFSVLFIFGAFLAGLFW